MGRQAIDLLTRIGCHIHPEPCEDNMHQCWEWTGPTIDTRPGPGYVRNGVMTPRSISGRSVSPKAPYRSPQPVSCFGELLMPVQALVHHFLMPDLFLPRPDERKAARDHDKRRNQGFEGKHSFATHWGFRALTGMFDGIRITPGAHPNCVMFGGPSRQGGLRCCNPWHALVSGAQTSRDISPPKAAQPAPETADELQQAIERYCGLRPFNAELFQQVFATPDRTPEALRDALRLADVTRAWKGALDV